MVGMRKLHNQIPQILYSRFCQTIFQMKRIHHISAFNMSCTEKYYTNKPNHTDLINWSHPRRGRSYSLKLSVQFFPGLYELSAPPPEIVSFSCCPVCRLTNMTKLIHITERDTFPQKCMGRKLKTEENIYCTYLFKLLNFIP